MYRMRIRQLIEMIKVGFIDKGFSEGLVRFAYSCLPMPITSFA